MADTLEIIPQNQLTALDAAIAKLDAATQNVVALAEAAQTVNFKIDGIDSLIAFVNTMKGAQAPISGAADATVTFNKSVTDLNATIEVFDDGLIDNVKNYVQLKGELGYSTAAIKGLTKQIEAEGDALGSLTAKVEDHTRRQFELKQEVSATTQAIKSQIKEQQAAAGSIDAMSQQLGQMREKYRALSAEQRNNANVGGVLQKQIAQLDGTVKELDKSIGNAQRNVGNYKDSFTVLGINVESVLSRMIVRMALMQVLLLPAIDAVGTLIEQFFKLSDAEQLAKDRLDDYNEGMKNLIKENAELKANVLGAIFFDQSKMNSQIAILKDHNLTLDQRFRAYKALQSIAPAILDDMDKEGFKATEGKKRMDEQLASMSDYIRLQEEINKGREEQQKFITAQQKNESDQELLRDKIQKEIPNSIYTKGKTIEQLQKELPYNTSDRPNTGGGSTKIGNDIAALNQLQKERNELNAKNISDDKTLLDLEHQKAALEGNTKDKKDHSQKDNKKEMEAMLAEENATYNLVLAKNKELYELSHKIIGVDDVNLLKENEVANESHSKRMIEITNQWMGKVGESREKYNARIIQIEADKIAVENATNLQEQEIALEVQKRHNDANKELDDYVKKLQDQRDKLAEIQRQINVVKDTSASQHKEAGGINPFLEGLGIPGTGQVEKIKELNIQLDAAKEKYADLEEAVSRAVNSGDAVEVGKANIAMKEQELNVDKIVAEKQIAIDDLIIASKKRIGEESIELAKTTMQSIITITDNGFAKQEQQLDILSKKQQIQNQQKIEQINASTNYQGVKDTQLAKQAAQSAAQQNQIQQQQNQLAVKKAEFDKKAAEAGIIMNTALAITKILANDAYDPPYAAALIGITTAIGAAQYAAAASAPIPQFFLGGKTETHIFSAAERGPELGITPQGQALMFDKPGTYTAPIGTTIKNADDTERIIRYAIHGMNYSAPTITGYDNNEAIAIKVAEIIGAKFDEVGNNLGWVIAKNKTVIPKQENVRDIIREMDNTQAFRRNAKR